MFLIKVLIVDLSIWLSVHISSAYPLFLPLLRLFSVYCLFPIFFSVHDYVQSTVSAVRKSVAFVILACVMLGPRLLPNSPSISVTLVTYNLIHIFKEKSIETSKHNRCLLLIL